MQLGIYLHEGEGAFVPPRNTPPPPLSLGGLKTPFCLLTLLTLPRLDAPPPRAAALRLGGIVAWKGGRYGLALRRWVC